MHSPVRTHSPIGWALRFVAGTQLTFPGHPRVEVHSARGYLGSAHLLVVAYRRHCGAAPLERFGRVPADERHRSGGVATTDHGVGEVQRGGGGGGAEGVISWLLEFGEIKCRTST